MKQRPLQPSQLPVVLHCPGPHLWCIMLPKTGTHSPETSVNGPPLPRGVNLLVTLTKVLFTFSSSWKSLLWGQIGKTSNLSSQQIVLWHYPAALVILLAHGEYYRGPLFLLFCCFFFFPKTMKVMQFLEHGAVWNILKRIMLVAVIQDLSVLPLRRSTWTTSSAQLLLLCTHYSSPCHLDRK